jgi:quercetin dioxygenase-like cupin family protein
MVLKEIIKELETSKDPVYKMLRKGENAHILAIGFNNGMLLKKHKSDIPARILVIKGEVVYSSDNGSTTLGLNDEYEIPVGEFHWVSANEDSMMLVMKGS